MIKKDNHSHLGLSDVSRSAKLVCVALLFSAVLCSDSNAAGRKKIRTMKAPIGATKRKDVNVPAGRSFRFSGDTYERLQAHKRVKLTGFPLKKQSDIDLELEQFSVTGTMTLIVEGTAEGDVAVPHPKVVMFKGRVADMNDSQVVLGISPHGNNGLIRMGEVEYFLAPARGKNKKMDAMEHVIARKKDVASKGPSKQFKCLAKYDYDAAAVPMADDAGALASYEWRVAFPAVECDYEFYQTFGDRDAALAYAIQLMGTVSSFYERDMNIKFYLPYIRVWTTSSDPYPSNNIGVTLEDFIDYWNANMSYVDRDLAHLLSSKPGWAGLGVFPSLCDTAGAYSVTFGMQGWFPRPVRDLDGDNWDLYSVAHETGHVFGSPHTHCYDPPIDNCGLAIDDCNDRAVLGDCIPGTIMSYCGSIQCGGYANQLLSFHTRTAERIRDYVEPSCLRYGLNPVYVDTANNGYEDGTISNPFNRVYEGVGHVIPGGTVYIAPGSYPEEFIADRPMTLQSTGGTVTIGP
jgi:hypothetical protein